MDTNDHFAQSLSEVVIERHRTCSSNLLVKPKDGISSTLT